MNEDQPNSGNSSPMPQAQPVQPPLNSPNTQQTPLPQSTLPPQTVVPPAPPPQEVYIKPSTREILMEQARHKIRDAHGRFISSHQPIPDVSTYHQPNLVSFEQTNTYKKEDPPIIDLKVTNPVTYLKMWLKRLLKNEGIDLRVRIRPLTAIAIGLAFATFFAGSGFSVARIFFPTSSPILKREVSFQGKIARSEAGDYYLLLPDSYLYKLRNSTKVDVNFANFHKKQVFLKGNLGREPNIITVREIIAFE